MLVKDRMHSTRSRRFVKVDDAETVLNKCVELKFRIMGKEPALGEWIVIGLWGSKVQRADLDAYLSDKNIPWTNRIPKCKKFETPRRTKWQTRP